MAQSNLRALLRKKRGLKRMFWTDFGKFEFFNNIMYILGDTKICMNHANLWLKLTLELR